jgi:protein-S-isoprenylcysteine O-methyltransferase Ste14
VNHDRGSNIVLVASMIVGIFTAFVVAQLVPAAAINWQQALVFWIGIVLMLAGVAFRWYAIRILGRFFTRDVATRDDQHVVEDGPYRLIRHPSYTGTLLSVFGFGLATNNWLALLLVLAIVLFGLGYRVRVEEQALCEALGDAYRDYMRRTRRFIPYLW